MEPSATGNDKAEAQQTADISNENVPLNTPRTRSNSVIDGSLGYKKYCTVLAANKTRVRSKSVSITDYFNNSSEQHSDDTQTQIFNPESSQDNTIKKSDITDAYNVPKKADYDAKPQIPTSSSSKEPLDSSVPIALMPVSKTAECYNMDHENRGKCVIFNNENFDNDELVPRKGSTLDALRLEKTFTKLGFDVKIHNDFTHQQIIDEIEKLSKLDHTDNDCLCVFTLTHGMQRDLIWARDVIYQSERLWKPFIASKCTTLAGKPKMFFFQACRGDESDSSVQLAPRSLIQTETDASPAGPASYEIPTHADFLLAHSSVQGFLGWRDPEYGTWYINCLCDVMDEHGTTMDLLNMLTLTARKVATEYVSIHDNIYLNNKRQVPSVTTMLTRSVYFPPKSKDE